MATITPVDIGAAPDDGNGDPLRTAFSKLNGNDSNINVELAGKALTSHTHSLADITDEGALAALNTVGTSEIDNDAVTLSKLANMATSSFIGRITAATGDPEILTATQARTILNVEDGANAPPFVTADYTDASVTLAKLDDIATDSFIGRDTAGIGVPEALSAATARSILGVEAGSTADQSAAEVPFTPTGDIAATDVQAAIAEVDSEKITTGSNIGISGSGVLVDKSGTTLRFKNVNAGSSKITIIDDVPNNEIDVDVNEANLTLDNMGGEVSTTQIGNNQVTLPKLSTIATASFLGRSSGGTGNVEVLSASGARTVLNVEDGAAAPPYDTADFSNNAVTLAKFQDIATASILGRVTAATGDPEVLTATQARSILNVEDGANAPPFVTADYTNDSVTYAKIQDVSAQWRVLGRISSGAGDIEEIDIDALTDETSPASADVIFSKRNSDGNLVKIQVGNLPTGGGGEANLGANLGAGVGIFESKTSLTLNFNSLVSQTTALTIAEDDPNDEIDFTIADAIAAGASGFMTGADKTKLDGIATGATDDTTVDAHIADATDAHDASAISNVPAGSIAATTIQAAIDELDTEKAASSHTHTLADVTDSGALAALATVGTAEIDNNAVTLAKLADIATDSFIGRDTAATGDPEVLSSATARSILNVEDGATADQTGAEIKSAYEGEANTNAFTDAEQTKLAGIATGATDDTTVDAHIADAVAAHAGTAISNAPAGSISATTVQAAIDELDGEKAAASITLTAGDALSGGGDLSTNRTFDLDINGTTDLAAPATNDELLIADTSTASAVRKADVASVVNLADHDALTNFVADEHVAHGSVTLTAGDGLSGGGTIAANRTFNVDISGATDDAAPARSDEILMDDGAVKKSDIGAVVDLAKPVESFVIAASDETTALTTGTAKVTFRMPYAFTLSEVRASVTTAPTGSVLTVDINETATTILSTKLTIDATEKTSETAATAPVISDAALADDAEITIDIDTVGSTIAGAGLKVTLIGNQA